MEEKKKDGRASVEKDDFWDIASLVPKRSGTVHYARSTHGVDLEFSEKNVKSATREGSTSQEPSTVIKRYIPPHSDERLTRKEIFDFCESYDPQNSLLHRVTLKKLTCPYHYYGEFLSDAIQYSEVRGTCCEYVPFFSYVPQYNQLSEQQRSFYFWFRENARQQNFIETDSCYVLLYVYELINLGNRLDVKESQKMLTALWNAYHAKFPSIESKLADWICDFSLIHRLPPPKNGTLEMVNRVQSLKEFYIAMPQGDIDGCVRSLLQFCNSYDYRKSKFYKRETAELFDTHIFGVLREAVLHYSKDGRILSGLTGEDSRLMRDAYAGALCVAKERYRIEVEYCSFSRSNELRFLVGDIVKYAENRIRGTIGVKSKMSVYSVSTELRMRIDNYLEENLPKRRVGKENKEKQAYEAMYDIPRKPFSLSDARKIEEDSWSTTRDLIEAFESEAVTDASVEPMVNEARTAQSENDMRTSFGALWEILLVLFEGREDAIHQAAKKQGKMPDALADEINEIASEAIGDALIEETSGGYRIIEDYRDMIE